MDNNCSWNNNNELLLQRWTNESKKYHNKLNSSLYYYKLLNYIFTLLYILLSSTSSGIAFYSTGSYNNLEICRKYGFSLSISVAFISLIAVVIATIKVFLKLDNKMENCKIGIIKLNIVIKQMELILTKPREKRKKANHFLKSVITHLYHIYKLHYYHNYFIDEISYEQNKNDNIITIDERSIDENKNQEKLQIGNIKSKSSLERIFHSMIKNEKELNSSLDKFFLNNENFDIMKNENTDEDILNSEVYTNIINKNDIENFIDVKDNIINENVETPENSSKENEL